MIVDEQQREIGQVVETAAFGFMIHAAQGSFLVGVGPGPYRTLADAVQRIRSHTNATCVVT